MLELLIREIVKPLVCTGMLVVGILGLMVVCGLIAVIIGQRNAGEDPEG